MENHYVYPILVLLMLVFTWYNTTYSYWLVTIFGLLLLLKMFTHGQCCTTTKPVRKATRRKTTRRRKK